MDPRGDTPARLPVGVRGPPPASILEYLMRWRFDLRTEWNSWSIGATVSRNPGTVTGGEAWWHIQLRLGPVCACLFQD